MQQVPAIYFGQLSTFLITWSSPLASIQIKSSEQRKTSEADGGNREPFTVFQEETAFAYNCDIQRILTGPRFP